MKNLYYDIKKCLGCKSCEISCAVAHSVSGDLFQMLREAVLSLPRKRVLFSNDKNYPFSCRHCKDAKCVDACMAAALTFDEKEGMISRDDKRCVGCWMCVMVCPYGAIRPNIKTKIPVQCDKCKDKGDPNCAKACPTHAIIWE